MFIVMILTHGCPIIKKFETVPYLKCKETGKIFYDVKNKSGILTRHLKKLNTLFTKETIGDFFIHLNYTKDISFVKCPICDFKTHDISNKSGALTQHIKTHGLSISKFCDDYPSYKSLWKMYFIRKNRIDFLNESEENRIECRVCNKYFKKITNKHLKKHNLTPSQYKEKYSVLNTCSDNTSKLLQLKSFKMQYDNVLRRIKSYDISPMFTNDEYRGVNIKYKYQFRCDKCNDVFIDHLDDGHEVVCRICNPKLTFKSNKKFEMEVYDFLKNELKISDIITNDRKLISPKEIDLLIPSKNIAIELNGLYWHSEIYKNKNYHIEKTNLVSEKGYRCIHIFEDEWIYKQEIIKNKLKHICGFPQKERIFARKCECRKISFLEKSKFLNHNHIQGNDISCYNVGAFYNGKLVAVMTFSKPRIALGYKKKNYSFLELSRLCTDSNSHIIGIASKLLNFSKQEFSINEIISYADLRFTDMNQNVYTTMGFKKISITQPNYYWSKGLKRYNRFNFQKHKLINDGFDKTKTEVEIMHERGYYRIWDCGNIKYKLDLNSN